jgi:hypothetical protein
MIERKKSVGGSRPPKSERSVVTSAALAGSLSPHVLRRYDPLLEGDGFELLVPPRRTPGGAPCGFHARLDQLREALIPRGTKSSNPACSASESASPSRKGPHRSYASRLAPIALSRGRKTVRGLKGRDANRIGHRRSQSAHSTVEDPVLRC